MQAKKPFVLIILDGWGYREETADNAIAAANTPHWDKLWRENPHTLISGSGQCVGLPEGQMGNSEVGHLNLGAGRVVPQDYTRINNAIENGSFFTNKDLLQAIDSTITADKAIHVLGLLSPGGVHSEEQQIFATLKLAKQCGAQKLYLHAFLDGRDTPPRSAMASLVAADALFANLGVGEIASLCGRYYAMDRDNRWERVQSCYDLLTAGEAEYHADNAIDALQLAYGRGENDEFVKPTSLHMNDADPIIIAEGDLVIFMNYRADRARELTRALTEENFSGFIRKQKPKLAQFISLTQYAEDIASTAIFPPIKLNNVLGEYLSEQGLTQLRIAETEKYAHVTFFFNGGREKPFANEERILIPSPKVATYDLQPEMSANELTDQLVNAISGQKQDVIICNYANADMVGHSGNFEAAVKAIETLDQCLERVSIALDAVNGELLITADHGNAEKMRDPKTKQAHTAHTSEPVPLIYCGKTGTKFIHDDGTLADIAPTLLALMGLPIPSEMTGKVLIQ